MKKVIWTLYKKDTKGKLRILIIESEVGAISQTSGLVGGKLTERISQCSAKNVGKSNETSPEQQANLEARSKVTAKLKEGYFLDKNEAMHTEVILPMLAKVYEKESKKVTYPCHMQPKLDGMRCLAIIRDGNVKLISRKNTPIETMDHIKRQLEAAKLRDCILDGELYAHGLSFQENMKLIKKYRTGKTEKILYHVYDIVEDLSFINRFIKLIQILKDYNIANLNLRSRKVQVVETLRISDENEMLINTDAYIFQGFEGAMLRWGTEGYKVNGRSSSLLKIKHFMDEAFEVIDVEPSERDPLQGTVICGMANGETFGAGMKFSHDERARILKYKADFIGQIAEIRFFERTDSGKPRFPVCHGFRLDK